LIKKALKNIENQDKSQARERQETIKSTDESESKNLEELEGK